MSEKKEEVRSVLQLARNKFLVCSPYCMWIATRKKDKDKYKYDRISGFYTTYESLLEGIVREKGKALKGESIEEQLADFAKLERQLKTYAKKIGEELDKREVM